MADILVLCSASPDTQGRGSAQRLLTLISNETIFNAIVSWKEGLFLLRSIPEAIEALPSHLVLDATGAQLT